MSVYAHIIDAIQNARLAEMSSSDEVSSDYDNGYADGLERAANIVQTLAYGGRVAIVPEDEPAFEDDGFSEQLRASS